MGWKKRRDSKVVDINAAKRDWDEGFVTLSYAEMMNGVFNEVLGKMLSVPIDVHLTTRVRHLFGRYAEEINKHLQACNKSRTEAAERFADKEVVPVPKDAPKGTKPTTKSKMRPVMQIQPVVNPDTGEMGEGKEEPMLDQNGNPIQEYVMSDANREKFNAELGELLATKVVIPFYKIRIDMETFPEILTSMEMTVLEKIVEWV